MSGIPRRIHFDELVKELAKESDIPPNEVKKLFLILGEKIMGTKCMSTLEFPFGIFSTQLLAPRVVKRIGRVPIYTPIQYTLKFVPAPHMIFDVPDVGGVSSGVFDPRHMYQRAITRGESPKTTIEEPTPHDPFEDPIDLEEFEEGPFLDLEGEDIDP